MSLFFKGTRQEGNDLGEYCYATEKGVSNYFIRHTDNWYHSDNPDCTGYWGAGVSPGGIYVYNPLNFNGATCDSFTISKDDFVFIKTYWKPLTDTQKNEITSAGFHYVWETSDSRIGKDGEMFTMQGRIQEVVTATNPCDIWCSIFNWDIYEKTYTKLEYGDYQTNVIKKCFKLKITNSSSGKVKVQGMFDSKDMATYGFPSSTGANLFVPVYMNGNYHITNEGSKPIILTFSDNNGHSSTFSVPAGWVEYPVYLNPMNWNVAYNEQVYLNIVDSDVTVTPRYKNIFSDNGFNFSTLDLSTTTSTCTVINSSGTTVGTVNLKNKTNDYLEFNNIVLDSLQQYKFKFDIYLDSKLYKTNDWGIPHITYNDGDTNIHYSYTSGLVSVAAGANEISEPKYTDYSSKTFIETTKQLCPCYKIKINCDSNYQTGMLTTLSSKYVRYEAGTRIDEVDVYYNIGNNITAIPNLDKLPHTNNGWDVSFIHSGDLGFDGRLLFTDKETGQELIDDKKLEPNNYEVTFNMWEDYTLDIIINTANVHVRVDNEFKDAKSYIYISRKGWVECQPYVYKDGWHKTN